jgi:hypothetical protein
MHHDPTLRQTSKATPSSVTAVVLHAFRFCSARNWSPSPLAAGANGIGAAKPTKSLEFQRIKASD